MAGIAVEDRGQVRLAVIDNQPTRNAFTSEMGMDLAAAVDEAEADPALRCVVVTGAGDLAFSSGHDLGEVLARPETASDPVKNAAFMLALSCDLRIPSRNAPSGRAGRGSGCSRWAGSSFGYRLWRRIRSPSSSRRPPHRCLPGAPTRWLW